MTKKGSSEIFGVKMKFSLEKVVPKFGPRNFFFRPPKLGAKSPPMKPPNVNHPQTKNYWLHPWCKASAHSLHLIKEAYALKPHNITTNLIVIFRCFAAHMIIGLRHKRL